ncbi:MAG: serine--tRNA ligase [Planctomycetota bacterium]
MLDIKFVRANLDLVRDGARRKRIAIDFERLIALDEERRALDTELGELRNRQNTMGRQIAQLKGDAKNTAIAEMGQVAARVKELGDRHRAVEESLGDILCRVPNPPSSEVPDGKDDTENVELSRWGVPPTPSFPLKDHVTLGTELGILDFARASKLSGPQTYLLKGAGALLELAVLRFALDHIVAKGFTPMIVPTLVKYEPLFGTAYFPGGEEQAYHCERDKLYLTGTSEVPVTAYHSDEVLSEAELPVRYAGYSACYRREAGAAGRDTKGLYRIHQFNKVEQVVICRNDPDESKAHHQAILRNAQDIIEAFEIPYRVVNVCTGDLGGGQVQKFDIECWMPSRGGYGETHSASRFHDYQSRRLNLRYRDTNGKMHFCHTLNNTVIATPRVLISILELNQQADGSVKLPQALVSYMGGMTHIRARGT